MRKEYKIGVISDIHSNFVALKAVFDELSKIDLDDVIIAGDIIGGFTQPNQTIDIIKQHNAKAIHGNREDYLRNYLDGKHEHWDKFHQMKPILWTDRELTDANMDYLFTLPSQIEFQVMGTFFRVVHGSPRNVSELVYKHEEDKITEALASVCEDVLICGHSHQQWHRKIDDTLIVNPGSAGLSFRISGMAPYSVLSFIDGSWSVEEKQASYNTTDNKKAFDLSNIEFYSPWENMLMHSIEDGKVATLAFLTYAKEYAFSKGWDGKDGLIPNEHWHAANDSFDWDNYNYVSRAKRPS